MKKTYRIKFTDGTPNSIITCEESSLERILHFHYTGKQIEGATITEPIPKPTYIEFESFLDEVRSTKINELIDTDCYNNRLIDGWLFTKCDEGLLCKPDSMWTNIPPILVTTVDELRYILELIKEIK